MAEKKPGHQPKDLQERAALRRREFLGAAGAVAVGAAISPALVGAEDLPTLRWGFVGTGGIANSMARVLGRFPVARLAAVSSRRQSSADEFAAQYGAERAFDSWQSMTEWDGVDAIYVATPTSVREEICIAAARAGKHVLAEKPFASVPSVQRIAAACRENGVALVDGTHFNHHPRTGAVLERLAAAGARPWSVASAFQFNLGDKSNIRYNPDLEPMGALGDAGWYNMRAAATYLPKDARLVKAQAFLRRDDETTAVAAASGVLTFDDGSSSTWNCGFDSGAVVMDLRITSTDGVVHIDNFLSQNPDGSADYRWKQGGWGPGSSDDTISVPSELPGSALMFQTVARLAGDAKGREASIALSERTQTLLDACWASGLGNEA
ncbi:MAG: Gfo/Idh/MocA family oxidoreductase [Pseudomonadota bacterium]